jgi:hypothetical protein
MALFEDINSNNVAIGDSAMLNNLVGTVVAFGKSALASHKFSAIKALNQHSPRTKLSGTLPPTSIHIFVPCPQPNILFDGIHFVNRHTLGFTRLTLIEFCCLNFCSNKRDLTRP